MGLSPLRCPYIIHTGVSCCLKNDSNKALLSLGWRAIRARPYSAGLECRWKIRSLCAFSGVFRIAPFPRRIFPTGEWSGDIMLRLDCNELVMWNANIWLNVWFILCSLKLMQPCLCHFV